MGLTLGLTFIVVPFESLSSYSRCAASRYFSADLLVAVDDAAAGQVVWRQLYDHPILWEDSNVVLAHFARDVRKDGVAVRQLNAKHRVGERFDYLALDLDDAFFFGHILCIA